MNDDKKNLIYDLAGSYGLNDAITSIVQLNTVTHTDLIERHSFYSVPADEHAAGHQVLPLTLFLLGCYLTGNTMVAVSRNFIYTSVLAKDKKYRQINKEIKGLLKYHSLKIKK